MARILVIEDSPDLAYGLRNNFEIEGHEVTVAEDGQSGLAHACDAAASFDLVVLDLMLPKLDGFQVLSRMRTASVTTPVIILTARGEETDVVRGLRLGADDYVTKPFGVLELLARVDALLRRTAPAEDQDRFDGFGKVTIDLAARSVRRGDEPVALTPKEFDLLVALLRRQGAVATRVELIREVWNYPDSVVTRTVDTHVAELRRKLEVDPANPRFILTVPRIGYRLDRVAQEDQSAL